MSTPRDVKPYHRAMRRYARLLVRAALMRSDGNRTHAARALGLQRTYLVRLIRKLRVAVPPPSPGRPPRQMPGLGPTWPAALWASGHVPAPPRVIRDA